MDLAWSDLKSTNRLSKSKSLDLYCDKLLAAVREGVFVENLVRAVDTFDAALTEWTKNNRSRFGIKDNRDFTNLLIETARNRNPIKEAPDDGILVSNSLQGTILNIHWRTGVWFGFIRRGAEYENVYFDSRGYTGEARELIPKRKVTFKLGERSGKPCAINVKISD